MAKSQLRIKARQLRIEGVSVKKIAAELQVSRSSVSTWVRNIVLTREQLEQLHKSALQGAEIGRFKSAEIRRLFSYLYGMVPFFIFLLDYSRIS